MKRLIFLFFLAIISPSWAATITAAAGGGNWSNTATWVGAATPTAADNVILAVTSGSVTVDVGTAVAGSVTAVAFINNFNFSAGQTLTVSGNVQFNSLAGGMTLLGTGVLSINATANLLSAGQTFPGSLVLNANATFTLGDNWTVTGSLVNLVTTGTLNANSMNVGGSLTTTGKMGGTTQINLNGSGTWSGISSVFSSQSVTINTAGTVTLGNDGIGGAGTTVTYTAGTVVNTNSIFSIGGTCTFNTGTMHWGSLTFPKNLSLTFPLSSQLILDGTLLMPISIASSVVTNNFSGAFNITTKNIILEPFSNMKYTAGQTLIVSGMMLLEGDSAYTPSIFSATASSSVFLKYTGSCQNNLIFASTLTDLDATPSTSPVTVWNTCTLTRTTNIVNGTYPPSCGGSTFKGFY